MATLQKQIAEKFLARLAESPDVDAAKVEQLRSAMFGEKKLKADELVRIFSLPLEGDLK